MSIKLAFKHIQIDLIVFLGILLTVSIFLSFQVWKGENEDSKTNCQIVNCAPMNWISTKKIAKNTYKTSISLEPNLSPSDAIKIPQYFVKQKCKRAKIKRITILYTVKTNIWVIWSEDNAK